MEVPRCAAAVSLGLATTWEFDAFSSLAPPIHLAVDLAEPPFQQTQPGRHAGKGDFDVRIQGVQSRRTG
jgi:hypothetical protein